MTIQLPSAVASILDEIGIEWPNIDEDQLSKMSQEFSTLASSAQKALDQGQTASQQFMAANKGPSIDAFGKCWNEIETGPLRNLADSGKSTSATLATMASSVAATKKAIISEVGPFTGGLGQLAGDALKAFEAALPQLKQILVGIGNTLISVIYTCYAIDTDFSNADHYPLSYSEYQKESAEGKDFQATPEESAERHKQIDEGFEAAGEVLESVGEALGGGED